MMTMTRQAIRQLIGRLTYMYTALVYSIHNIIDIEHPCYGQLTAVKTRHLWTSITGGGGGGGGGEEEMVNLPKDVCLQSSITFFWVHAKVDVVKGKG